MDECDIANEIAEKYLNGAISFVLDACRTDGRGTGFRRNDGKNGGSAECIDCGMEIPEARRAAVPGCVRCVGCQKSKERRA